MQTLPMLSQPSAGLLQSRKQQVIKGLVINTAFSVAVPSLLMLGMEGVRLLDGKQSMLTILMPMAVMVSVLQTVIPTFQTASALKAAAGSSPAAGTLRRIALRNALLHCVLSVAAIGLLVGGCRFLAPQMFIAKPVMIALGVLLAAAISTICTIRSFNKVLQRFENV